MVTVSYITYTGYFVAGTKVDKWIGSSVLYYTAMLVSHYCYQLLYMLTEIFLVPVNTLL